MDLGNIAINIGIAVLIFLIQGYYFIWSKVRRKRYQSFFRKSSPYSTVETNIDGGNVTQIEEVENAGKELRGLISEINKYIAKTKGTTDFSIIQNKVERRLDMLYEQATDKLAFPVYIGLMGTFAGVFSGIIAFLSGMSGTEGITEDAIRDLLHGVLVSMSTSLIGLFLTTWGNSSTADARKIVEGNKNVFYDFIQTELMPELDVSIVAAISNLHRTVNSFQTAFNSVINNFQETFDRCTSAFGQQFEKNVRVVASAVNTMGGNMDKINKNIDLQQKLLAAIATDEIAEGLQNYIDAADHFEAVTDSLKEFEQGRQMLLDATQETIRMQKQYADSLKVPLEITTKVNQILDRITEFEKSINALGIKLAQREILGNDVVNAIQSQINSIEKKNDVAENYTAIADENLEKLFKQQAETINRLNDRYRDAIQGHADGFEQMLDSFSKEIEKRYQRFLSSLDNKFSGDELHQDLMKLRKLDAITERIDKLAQDPVRSEELKKELQEIKDGLSSKSKKPKESVTQKTNEGENSNPYAKAERKPTYPQPDKTPQTGNSTGDNNGNIKRDEKTVDDGDKKKWWQIWK